MAKKINKFKNLPPNTAVADLIKLIREKLPLFPYSQEIIDVLEKKKNENQHSLAFCLFMTNECQSFFYFSRENSQKGTNVIDIGVYRGSNLIFTLEAKLLPTPKSSKSRKEYEYVYGHGGGIQRFKDCKHGLDNSHKLLLESGMLAYIKSEGFPHWLKKVNKWVDDAGWGTSEQLQKSARFGKIMGVLESNHQRTDGSNIKLTHFWIKVS